MFLPFISFFFFIVFLFGSLIVLQIHIESSKESGLQINWLWETKRAKESTKSWICILKVKNNKNIYKYKIKIMTLDAATSKS